MVNISPYEGKAKVLYFTLALGVVGAIACLALFFALSQRSGSNLIRAFNALENDFANLEDTVKSALGRAARLKRANMQLTQEQPGEGASPEAPALTPLFPGLNEHQSRLQAMILKRRMKA
jgi:hypothetical protein